MQRKRRKPTHLDHGGATWSGWTFTHYGRAREWRLISPAGETYTVGDLQELRGLVLDVDYLRDRVRTLESTIDARACHFSREDVVTMQAAIRVLGRALPAAKRQVRQLTLVPEHHVAVSVCDGQSLTARGTRRLPRHRPTARDFSTR